MTWLRRKLKGWKTVIFGVAIAAGGALAEILDALRAVDIAPLLPPSQAARVIAVIGVITILLRLATTGRVGHKED